MDDSYEWYKKESDHVAAAIEEKSSILSKEMTLQHLWKLHGLYEKKVMVAKMDNHLKKLNQPCQ